MISLFIYSFFNLWANTSKINIKPFPYFTNDFKSNFGKFCFGFNELLFSYCFVTFYFPIVNSMRKNKKRHLNKITKKSSKIILIFYLAFALMFTTLNVNFYTVKDGLNEKFRLFDVGLKDIHIKIYFIVLFISKLCRIPFFFNQSLQYLLKFYRTYKT